MSRKLKILAIAFLLFALAVTFILIQKNSKAPDIDRFALIDASKNHFLIRGNNVFLPDKNNKRFFASEKLSLNIRKTLNKNNYQIDNFYLIDISLLDIDEYFATRVEKEYFRRNPENGKVINFSILLPELFFIKGSNFIANYYHAKITKLLEEIHQNLLQNNDKNIVVYVHCDSGRDRNRLYFICLSHVI